jgi:TolB protein
MTPARLFSAPKASRTPSTDGAALARPTLVTLTIRLLSLLAFAGGLLSSLSQAQEAPLIEIVKSNKVAVSVAAFQGPDGVALAQIVQKDLQLSGAFTFGGTPAYQISALSQGSSLRGQVRERSGSSLFDRSYSGSPRALAHAFANDVIQALTGSKGIAGTRIAFVANKTGQKEIYTIEIDGTQLTQLTQDRSISVSPALSADGSRLAYTGYQSGYADVYQISLGSGSRQRIMKFPGTNSGAAYSPDSSQLAVTLSKDGNPELYVTDASGGSPRRLTFTAGVESSPTWSPDGREIIYSSDQGGSPTLYRISASGGSPHPLRTGFGYNTEPHWSPDGKRVVFNTRSGGGFTIASLELATGQVRTLAEGQDPVWTANSRHVVFAQGGSLLLLDTQTLQKSAIISGLGRISEPSCSR